jgi:hypothetical protein
MVSEDYKKTNVDTVENVNIEEQMMESLRNWLDGRDEITTYTPKINGDYQKFKEKYE